MDRCPSTRLEMGLVGIYWQPETAQASNRSRVRIRDGMDARCARHIGARYSMECEFRPPSSSSRDGIVRVTNTVNMQLLVISTSFLAMRIWTRATSRGIGLHMDDYILLAGWFVCVLATGCVHWLMIEFLVPGSLRKIILARAHLCLQSVALGLTKTSFAVTLLRLLPRGWEHVVIWTLIFSMNAQFIAHMFATWQPVCGVEDEGHFPVRCWTLKSTVDFAVFSACESTHPLIVIWADGNGPQPTRLYAISSWLPCHGR
jgi:hypothetical protein